MPAGLILSQSNINISPVSTPANGLYIRGLETPRADTVLMDDFSNGLWYAVDSDHTAWQTVPPGWAGTIFSNPITPPNAVRNLAVLGKKPLFTRSDYAATTGFIQGVDGGVLPARNHAWHNLLNPGNGGYAELYIRFYSYFMEAGYLGVNNPSAPYRFGAQKGGTINRPNDSGGIYWGGLGYNIGAGSNSLTTQLNFTNNHGTNEIWHQNISTLTMTAGHWYYNEARVKLNTVGSVNGVFQLWQNDGGANGDFSGQTPTLRSSFSNIDYGRTAGETQLMGVWWPENWSNPASVGEQLWLNMHIATNSQIGFAS